MRRILKFTVQPFAANEIETADEPRFVAAGWQGENLVVWAEATVGSGVLTRLTAIPTGGDVPDFRWKYVATAQHPTMLDGNPLVMHVYSAMAL